MTESLSGDSPTSSAEHGVGLVVVSHSRTLARSAVALAAEMLHGRPLRIEVAAGLDETTFGTDAVAIMEAIERADGPAGVVVLMDLGSAVLSTELALDLLQDPSIRDRVTLSPAPLVEGLIVAAVAAAGGASRAEVAAEARDALMGKSGHLSTPPDGAAPGRGRRRCGGGRRRLLGREPPRPARPAGRPARQRGPCARRVGPAAQPHHRAARPVPAGSLSRVATLAALRGHEVEVRASGPQAQEAVEHLLTLAARRFDETVEEAAEPPAPVRGRIGQRPAAGLTRDRDRPGPPAHRGAGRPRPGTGGGAGRGVATHRGVRGRRTPRHRARPGRHRARGGRGAGEHLRRAPLAAHRRRDARRRQDPHQRRHRGGLRLGRLPGRRRARVGEPARPLPEGAGRGRPRGRRPGAAGADGRARPADDVAGRPGGQRPDARRDGRPGPRPGDRSRPRPGEPDVARGHPGPGPRHPGRRGGRPRGARASPKAPPSSSTAAAASCTSIPSPELLEEYERRAADAAEQRARQLALAEQPAVSRDGTSVAVAANLGSVADARAALAAGADGAGLVRTEFLFLDRSAAPSVEEQQAEYDAIAEAMDGRRITLRTLDVGGDKPLSYLPMPPGGEPVPRPAGHPAQPRPP